MPDWAEGVNLVHMGWLIIAVSHQGEQVWSTIDPTPIGQTLRQFFPSAEEAVDYIDNRETEKVLFKIKYGGSRR